MRQSSDDDILGCFLTDIGNAGNNSFLGFHRCNNTIVWVHLVVEICLPRASIVPGHGHAAAKIRRTCTLE